MHSALVYKVASDEVGSILRVIDLIIVPLYLG